MKCGDSSRAGVCDLEWGHSGSHAQSENGITIQWDDDPPIAGGQRLVSERMSVHGDPLVNVEGIADMWETLFDHRVDPADVCLAMILVKVQRERTMPHPDNIADIEGYAYILSLCRDKENTE